MLKNEITFKSCISFIFEDLNSLLKNNIKRTIIYNIYKYITNFNLTELIIYIDGTIFNSYKKKVKSNLLIDQKTASQFFFLE